jgi:hypothetical protein
LVTPALARPLAIATAHATTAPPPAYKTRPNATLSLQLPPPQRR